jgi:hypothetical protein
MGSKADGVNLAETRETALGSLGGGQPRSIRKRGYHRALKRGETWAVCEKAYKEMVNDFCAQFYHDISIGDPILGVSAWLPETGEDFFGTDRTVPLKYPAIARKFPAIWSRIKSWFRR